MYEFFVLGHIPGTNLTISWVDWVVTLLLLVLAFDVYHIVQRRQRRTTIIVEESGLQPFPADAAL